MNMPFTSDRPQRIEPMRLPMPWRLWVTAGSYVAAVAVAGAVTLWAIVR